LGRRIEENKMNEEKEKAILEAVNDAFGVIDAKYFDIEKSEILDAEEDCFSMTVCVKPSQEYFADKYFKAEGGENYLQIDLIDGQYCLMAGEDAEIGLDITRANIYAQFYWGEVLQEK